MLYLSYIFIESNLAIGDVNFEIKENNKIEKYSSTKSNTITVHNITIHGGRDNRVTSR